MVAVTAGRSLFSIVGFLTSTGCYIADWNYTHIYNPRWPPHAKFHNGQTMSMGLLLGLFTLYKTWRSDSHQTKESVMTTGILGGLYWITAFSAILYPGTSGADPEFGGGFPQAPFFGGILVTNLAAWWLEHRRVAAVKAKET